MSDNSPLFKVLHRTGKPDFFPSYLILNLTHELYFKAGLVKPNPSTKMYDLRANNLRMFFRSQMAFLGVNRDIIEYIMGHKTNHYLDVKMKGIEYLRSGYRASGISITRKAENDKIQILKQMVQNLGFTPEEVLRPEFCSKLGGFI